MKLSPQKGLNFIKTSKIPCAKEMDDEPVFYDWQSESFDEEDRESYNVE